MKKLNFAAALVVSSLFLPIASQAEDNLPIEISYKEAKSGNWKRIGAISFTQKQRTSAELLEDVRIEAKRRGATSYYVSRLQLMRNSSWSVNAAIFIPAMEAM